MNFYQIPVDPQVVSSRKIVLLGNREFVFTMKFDFREERFFLDLELTGQKILNAVKLVSGVNFCILDTYFDVKRERLFLYDTERPSQPHLGRPADWENFGKTVLLMYGEDDG